MAIAFVPLSTEGCASLMRGGQVSGDAFSATPAFLETFDLDDPTDEDAERTLLYLAGLSALQAHGRRLVAVVNGLVSGDGELGEVTLDPVGPAQVEALFADDEASADLVKAAADAVRGLSLDAAWDAEAHERLLADADLSWYGPEEWERLAR